MRDMINPDWLNSDNGAAYDLRTLIACDLGSDDEGFNGLTGGGDEGEEDAPEGADVDENGYAERAELNEEDEEGAELNEEDEEGVARGRGRQRVDEIDEIEYL